MDNHPIRIDRVRTGNVIVVDPQPEDYTEIVSSVDERQLRLHLFATGDEAIRSSAATWCELWLVNMQLPDMTGIELMSLIRERDPQAAVFLVGNVQDSKDEIAARSAGSTAYVCKPAHAVWLSGLSVGARVNPTGQAAGDSSLTPSTAHY